MSKTGRSGLRHPAFEGVINLRVKVIPVTDRRRRFGMSESASTDRTGIIVPGVGLFSEVKPAGSSLGRRFD